MYIQTYFVYLIWIAREKFPDHTTQGKTQPGAMKKPSPVFNIPFSILPAKTKAFKIITTLKMFIGIYRVFTGKSECGDFKITGIAGIHAIPIIFHLRYACRYCIKKYVYLTCYQLRIYRKSPQILQGYHQKLCYYIVSPQLIHDFHTTNVGYPCKIELPANIAMEVKVWGFQDYRDFG